jgi:flagellar L-ring protein precursor FlgH
MKSTHPIVFACVLAFLAPGASGQSLLERPAPPPAPIGRPTDTASALRGVSLFLVTPPEPKGYKKNDIIEIIINETSAQQSDQKLDAKKELTNTAELSNFPSIRNLIQTQVKNGDSTNKANLDVTSKADFKGDGQYARNDRFTARIAAIVLEVKPNGNLVLEARKAVNANKEETMMVLSGVCRAEDITLNNTVQSSQLANLTLTVKNEGDAKNAASKGILTQLFDTIFNF